MLQFKMLITCIKNINTIKKTNVRKQINSACNDCALFVFFILDADVKLIPSVVSGVNILTLNS